MRLAREDARAWWIVALSFCGLALTFAGRSSVGVMIPAWEAELGWARAVSATGSSIVLAVMVIAAPWAGDLLDRVGARRVLALGLAVVGASILATSTVTREWQFLALFGLLGGVGYGVFSLPLVTTMLSMMLGRGRGLGTGVALAGATAGQLPALTLLGVLVTAWGWRGAYVAFGLALLVLVPLVWLALGRPAGEDAGGGSQQSAARTGGVTAGDPLGVKIRFLARSRTFLIFMGVYWLCGFTTAGVFDVHFVPYAVSCGFPLVDGTAAHGLHGVGNMLGLMLIGWLTDRVHRARLLAAMYVIRALLFVVLLHVAGNMDLLFAFAIAFGVLNFSTLLPMASLIATHVGVGVMGLTMGLLFGSHSLGAAIGAVLGGYMFDLTARYDWVWMIAVGLALLAALLSSLVAERPDDARPRWGVPAAA